MIKYDVSFAVPTIRTQNLELLYNTCRDACCKYSFEFIFVGPYSLPASLRGLPNITYVRDFGCSTRCTQIAAIYSQGKLFARVDDDDYFFPDSMNQSIDLYNSLRSYKDVIILRYREGQNHTGSEFPKEIWTVQHHEHLRQLRIPHAYKFGTTFLISLEYFKEIGGIDCTFEHVGYAPLDLSFRIQNDGGQFHFSPIEVLNADWIPGFDGDHRPIWESHADDQNKLFAIYNSDLATTRTKIDFDNWKSSTEWWERRFGQKSNMQLGG